jgi:nuclear pore complex protein Nup62
MFGANNNQNNSPFSFGSSSNTNNANAGAQSTGFGQSGASNLFGQSSNTAGNTSTGFGSVGFGQASAAANPTPGASTGTSLFGQSTNTAAPAGATATGFGGASAAASAAPSAGGFSFGSTSTPAASSAAGFSFGGATKPALTTSQPAASGSLFGGAATSTSGSLFGGATATPAAPTGSGFNFGNTATATSTPAPAASGFSFGNAAASAAPSSGASGFGFNLGSSSQAKTGSVLGSAPGFGSALAGATGLSNPPAVLTTAPLSSAPSVPSISSAVQSTIPSLLHKKDMQDILSEWTNEVKNLTDEFLTQSKEVSKWDQVVRDNTKTINQLITASKECSTYQSNIDSNIEYVLAQQEELNKILDEYETKIDDKIQAHNLKQQQEGTSLTSADTYRESTMNTANSLAQDLQNVEKQLEDILKETKTYSDQESSQLPDSVNQILGILNAHLLALEQLNSSSSELDSKIYDLVKNNSQSQSFIHNHTGSAVNNNSASGIFPGASLSSNPHPRSTIQRNFYQAQESLNSQNSFFGGNN